VRLTLAWTEQAIAARSAGNPLADAPGDDPFEGPVFDTDEEAMAALDRAGILARLDQVPHEGMSLEDSHEEGWFDLDQLDALIAALRLLLAEARAVAGSARPTADDRVVQWLEGAIAFSQNAQRLQRGVCFWL
jgi:hypothetical protein